MKARDLVFLLAIFLLPATAAYRVGFNDGRVSFCADEIVFMDFKKWALQADDPSDEECWNMWMSFSDEAQKFEDRQRSAWLNRLLKHPVSAWRKTSPPTAKSVRELQGNP